jgi:hypothetical protein
MAAATLLGVGLIVFVLLRVVPGDPIAMMIAPGASDIRAPQCSRSACGKVARDA